MSTIPSLPCQHGPIGVTPQSVRLEMRDPFGDLHSTYLAACDELRRGQFGNAWAGFHVTLNTWLRHKFVDVTGRLNSPVHGSPELLMKLRSACIIDRWTHHVLRAALVRPQTVTRRSVDILAGIVLAICFDGASPEGLENPT